MLLEYPASDCSLSVPRCQDVPLDEPVLACFDPLVAQFEISSGLFCCVTPITAVVHPFRHSPSHQRRTAPQQTTAGVGPMNNQTSILNRDENRELTIGELDAVNGGFLREIIARIVEAVNNAQDNKKQADAVKGFQQMLQDLP